MSKIRRLGEEQDEHDEGDREWREFVDELDDMLFDDDYSFASDTIEGIKGTVEKTHKVTEGQRTAIENIKNSVEERGD